MISKVLLERKGFETAKQDAGVPIIFLTAKSMKDDVVKGYNIGAGSDILDIDVFLHAANTLKNS